MKPARPTNEISNEVGVIIVTSPFYSRRLPENVNRMINELPPPVREFFYEMISAERSPRTIANYAYDFALFFSYLAQNDLTYQQVTSEQIKQFFRYIENGYVRTVAIKTTHVNPKTGEEEEKWIRRTHHRENTYSGKARKRASLRSLFRFLHRNGSIGHDPMEQYEDTSLKVGKRHRMPVFLSAEEAKRLIEAVSDYYDNKRQDKRYKPELESRDRAIMLVLLNTGMRVSELVQLDENSIQNYQGAAYVTVVGKGNKERVLKLNRTAMQAVATYTEDRRKLVTHSGQKALFVNRYGKRMSRKTVYEVVKKYVQRAGLPPKTANISPHKLRHTLATLLLQNGENLRVVQEILGHASIKTTEVYTHVINAEKDEALDQLDRFFNKFG